MNYRHLLTILVATFFFVSPIRATTVVTDGTFANADWTSTILTQTGPAASFSAAQAASGGNPGTYRALQHNYGGLGSIVTVHVFSQIYDPAIEGAIDSVQFDFDLIGFDLGESLAVKYGGLIFQDGTYHRFDVPNIATIGVWENRSIVVDSGPDFSATGAPLQFGYFASNGTGNASSTSTQSGLDNWSAGVTPIPEPSRALLLCLGALGLGLRRRRG